MYYKNIIYIILFFLILILFFIFIVFFIKKTIKIHKNEIQWNKMQLPELQDNKKFIFSDGSKIKIIKNNFNKNDNNIYLFIHDIFGLNNYIINYIKKSNKNIISFTQFNFNENYQKNFSLTKSQILELIKFLKNKYENKKINIIAEGFGCTLILSLIKNNKEFQFLLINPILNHLYLNLSYITRLKMNIPYIARLNQKININLNYHQIMDNNKNNDLIFKSNFLYLYKIIKITKNFRINDNKNVIIFQAKNSYFYSGIKTKKKFKNVKLIQNDINIHSISSGNSFDEIFKLLFSDNSQN